ncbi:hypothetical protein KRP22_001921 [Phytophthora ramorum]|nr:hypothetical protein KRP22_1204 [Phytophthora ramorum]
MRFSASSHHLKKTSLWESGNQTEADADLTTPDILNKATATIRASLDVNAPQNIWAALGLHLQTQLLQQNSMSITDFGTFGFNQKNEPIFVQDPVFLHMTRLCLASRKRGNAVQPAFVETERIHDIDFNGLAAEYLQNCSKDLVKSVISSVLAWVVSWAKSGQQMQLSFLPVGEWVCDGDSVDFRFLESFRKEVELKSGAVNIDEMIKHYDVGFLPQVRDGMLSRLEALTAFLQEWASIDTANTNSITFETFMEYYHNVSACINNDADFTRLMQQAWHIQENAQGAVERIRARVAGTRGENTQAGKLPPVDLNVLEKWLQLASSNGDSLLLKYELRGGLMKVGIDISYQDLDYLFAYFDVDRQGFISCDTFLDVLRNPTKALPKLANRQENTRINPAQKPEDVHVDSQQSASLYTTTLPHTVVRRKKQAAPQEPQPNFRRRNLIHRAIWGQIMKPAVNETLGIRTSLNKLEVERRRRYRAAQLIQTTFRGFRARQMTAQLRRKAAAQSHRFVALEQEQERLIAKKKKANRTILPSAYGF